MADCSKCIHNAVCKTAESCDGYVSGCEHFNQGWISVKERLPERTEFVYEDRCEQSGFGKYLQSEWVLVHTKCGSITAGFLCDDYWDTDSGVDDVTHWMPLPEAPKGE